MTRRAEPAAPSHLVRPLLQLVEERGARLDLSALGLPPDTGEATPVTPSLLGRLFDAAAEALDEPHLGLCLPSALKFSRYELPELAARSAATLRDSMQRLIRYAPLLGDAVAFDLAEEGGLARFSQHVRGHPRGVSAHLNEFSMAMGVHECRARTGRAMAVREVCFVHPRPRGPLDPLIAHFGTAELRFGNLKNTLVFDAAVLDAPQLTSDPRLLETADSLAEAALKKRPAAADGFRAVVERAVRERLDQPELTIRSIAAGLRMSTRTLQRRLEDEGTGFAEVLDGAREVLARELVARPEVSLSEVAFLLGFAEFATFSRAFKRWTGSPPGAFRRG